LFIAIGAVLLLLLLALPPVRQVGNWEPGGRSHALDRIKFGYGPSYELVWQIGKVEVKTTAWTVTRKQDPQRTLTSFRWGIDWLWFVVQAVVGLLLVGLGVWLRRKTPTVKPA
jgi:hypothetical protein